MRKLLTVLAVAGATTLGSCATDPNTGIPTINQQQLASVEAQIQQTAANVCKFVPTIATVSGVIASYVSAGAVVDLVNQAVNQICAAIAAVPAAPTTPATVNGARVRRLAAPLRTDGGVLIQGYFIR